MRQPASRAQSIAARLSTAGHTPRVTHRPDHIRIEVDSPKSPTPASWRRLLSALEQGDQFGLHTDGQGAVAWAVVFTEGPYFPSREAGTGS